MFTPRNVRIGGRRTSIRLEPELWSALEDICEARGQTIDAACTAAAREKSSQQNITSAIRSYIVRNLYTVHCSCDRCSVWWRDGKEVAQPSLAMRPI